MLSPLEEKEMEYSVGCSFVAIHGIDIVSEFQIRSFSYTEWNLEWKLEPFIISRGMKIPIKIYKLDKDGNEHLIKRMNARKTSHLVSMRNKETPDFVGQIWLAKDLKSNIISSFMALPGCTTWEFQERETKNEDSHEYVSFSDSPDPPPPPSSPPPPSPSPPPLENNPILLLDANGEDKLTKILYEARNKFIYTKIETTWSALVGPNVTRENLHKQLKNRNLRFVSSGSHGRKDCLIRMRIDTTDVNSTILTYFCDVILTSNEVRGDPDLASNKIFHIWACSTGASNGLGETLVRNGATAYIGYSQDIGIMYYNTTKEIWVKQFEPDCEIVNTIIRSNIGENGDANDQNVCKDAVHNGRISFVRLAIELLFSDGLTTAAGMAIHKAMVLRYVDENTLP